MIQLILLILIPLLLLRLMTTQPPADPTITVNRRTLGKVVVAKTLLGKVAIDKTSVDAGSRTDLKITYTFTEDVQAGVIDIVMPAGWGSGLSPRVLTDLTSSPDVHDSTDDDNDGEIGSDEVGKPLTNGYVYLGDPSREIGWHSDPLDSPITVESDTATTDEAGEAI